MSTLLSGVGSVPPVILTDRPADRLGDDVVAVVNALNLKRPILVGHYSTLNKLRGQRRLVRCR